MKNDHKTNVVIDEERTENCSYTKKHINFQSYFYTLFPFKFSENVLGVIIISQQIYYQ